MQVLAAVAAPLAATVAAQAQKKAKETKWDGRVRMIKKEDSTIVLRVGAAERQVIYSADTKFTVLNKPGSLADVKDGGRLIVLGTMDAQGRLMATRVDARLN
jgi:hypothetical protein